MRARGKSASNLARCKSIVPSLQMQHSRAFRLELYVAHSFRAIIVDTVIAIETRILFRCRAINLERVHVARQMRKPLQLLPAPFGAPFRLPGHLSPGFSTRASLAFLSLSLSLSLLQESSALPTCLRAASTRSRPSTEDVRLSDNRHERCLHVAISLINGNGDE